MGGDNLLWLSQWYLSQCDGDWEHSNGVSIETLDNPGWSLKIELADTPLEGLKFDRVSHGEPGQNLEAYRRNGSWWIAKVEGDVFEASCGPLDLSKVVGIFRAWAEFPRV